MVYLDNAATTKPSPSVIETAVLYMTEGFGNPSSIYSLGTRAKNATERAREQVAKAIGAKPEHIFFTSGGTEANNLAIFGVEPYLESIGRTEIISSKAEHDSVYNSIIELRKKSGFNTQFLRVDSSGSVDVENFLATISSKTGLVSLMYVNNEVGAVNQVEKIGEICREHGILFHTDCVQALGTVDIDVNRIGCDFLSISSHKIRGLKGTGALFVRNPALINPRIIGSAQQEGGLRGGTENVAGIAAFGQACEDLILDSKDIQFRIANNKSAFIRALTRRLSNHGILDCWHDNAKSQFNQSKIVNFRFDKVDAETLILMAANSGVYVSAGSACHSHESKPSRVLLELGLCPEEARNSIRVSFSGNETDEEIEFAAYTIADSVKILLISK